ncbi:DUF736 domain-containing protein [Rhizobium laguerreae]|uniref:DUF736 domain-containing protein n=1 Tax=Rhizobium laguerreae TaxID=1076926 RepID=UPI001389875F|nr:DUF736 family protein [Rhizobium laguerreae]NDK52801.1 DUF736 family protein [Rhizobium laguerreae]
MTTIGKFKKSNNNAFSGGIFTVELQSSDVHIIPFSTPVSANAPSHRVIVGGVEIGVAWTRLAPKDGHYLRLDLDEPSFAAPIYADLFKDQIGEGFTLVLARGATPQGGG